MAIPTHVSDNGKTGECRLYFNIYISLYGMDMKCNLFMFVCTNSEEGRTHGGQITPCRN